MVHTPSNNTLAEQNVETLDDLTKLTPLTHEVISRQATINIGTIGHVAHGKTTCVFALTGKRTVRFKKELVRNITIKLGYANAKIFECSSDTCPRPGRYSAHGSETPDTPHGPACAVCGSPTQLRRHVSFVDCPGHDILMATMLNGTAVMDAAMLLVAGNESCPQSQTSEHVAALEIMQLQHVLILQNKIDLTSQQAAARQYEEARRFINGTHIRGSPIIPISAQLRWNLDYVCEYLCNYVPMPSRKLDESPQLTVVRSFDVNKPGTAPEDLKGGIVGGTLLSGVLRIGDEIEVRPGYVTKDAHNRITCRPLRSTIRSLTTEDNQLEYAVPGGLIGVGTDIDPSLTRSDTLVGHVLGLKGQLPEIYIELDVKYQLFTRLMGVKEESRSVTVRPLSEDESLLLNIGSQSTGGRIRRVGKDEVAVVLNTPVCSEANALVSMSRRIDKHWRLIGHGSILCGKTIAPCYDS